MKIREAVASYIIAWFPIRYVRLLAHIFVRLARSQLQYPIGMDVLASIKDYGERQEISNIIWSRVSTCKQLHLQFSYFSQPWPSQLCSALQCLHWPWFLQHQFQDQEPTTPRIPRRETEPLAQMLIPPIKLTTSISTATRQQPPKTAIWDHCKQPWRYWINTQVICIDHG